MHLHPLSLSFRDSELENEYKASNDYEARAFNRIGIALSAIAWLILNIYCYLFYSQIFLHMTVTLVIFLYPLFIFIFVVTASEHNVKYYQPLSALANCLAGLMFVYVGHFLWNNVILTICGIMACVLFGFFILRIRFKIALIDTLIFIAVYEASLLMPSVHENPDIPLLAVIGILIELMCIVGGYSLERNSRKMFYQNKELVRQRQLAEAATQAKSEFLANMSHECRTPLNAIIGMSHLASQTILTTKQRGYLETIYSSAQTLLEVINDILDFSKIEAGKMDIELVDFKLDDILTNLANLFNLTAQQKGIELLFQYTTDVPQRLRGDPFRLGQVLSNLVNNAIKFTDHGEIIVKIEPLFLDKEKLTLQFSVHDTGIGISKEQQNKLFLAFSQVDASTTRKYGGSGLGLAICERLVNLMGGRIWLESDAGVGSTFFFTVVCGYNRPLDNNLDLITRRESIKVLVVDHNPIAVGILTDMLKSLGFTALGISCKEQELAALREGSQDFDVVIMDREMFGLNGLKISSRTINFNETEYRPKIITTTTSILSEPVDEEGPIGIHKCLTKPITQSQLLNALMDVLDEGRDISLAFNHDGYEPVIWNQLVDTRGARILLVDDNEINQQVGQEILQHMGFLVDIASNGLEALEALEEVAYDMVFMDVHMPVMDGYEATRRIRSRSCWTHLPVIAITAHALSTDLEKSLQAGMNDQVNKPINPEELMMVIAKYIKNNSQTSTHAGELDLKSANADNLPWPKMPGIVSVEGLARVGGNRELYKKLLLQFAHSNTDTPDKLKNALAKGDINEASRLLHTVKGVTANIGANRLAAAAADLETALIQGSIAADNDVLFQEFIASLTLVTDGIRAFEETVTVPDSKEQYRAMMPVDADILRPQLISLAQMLESGSIQSMTQLSILESFLTNTRVEKQFKQLKQDVNLFDMDSALGKLKAIASDLNISI